jgi:hypothetical protein
MQMNRNSCADGMAAILLKGSILAVLRKMLSSPQAGQG